MSQASCLVAAVGLLGIALPAKATAQVEFTPFFTSFYAITPVDDAVAGDPGVEEKQFAAPGFGAKLTFWLGNSFGIEGAGTFAFSGTRFVADNPTGPSGSFSLSGTIWTSSLRMLYRPARTNMHFLLGGGVIGRGGDTWDFDFITSKTDFGGVAGFGVRAAVTPKFALNVNVESFLYQTDPDGDGGEYDGKMQADIYVSIGVPISFGGR